MSLATAPHCPACARPVHAGATRCTACGLPLVEVPCPRCAGLVLLGEPNCPHCGADTIQTPLEGKSTLGPCPACAQALRSFRWGAYTLAECPGCHGVWMDGGFVAQLCAHAHVRDTLAERLSADPVPAPAGASVTFRTCPVCGSRMSRVIFGHTSNVTLDACPAHGVWFDEGELERILAFLRWLSPDAAQAALAGLGIPAPGAAEPAPTDTSRMLRGMAVGGALAVHGERLR